MENFKRRLLISVFVFAVIHLVLNFLLYRINFSGTDSYISPSILFFNGFVSLLILALGFSIPAVIVLFTLKYGSRNVTKFFLALVSMLAGIFIFVIISGFYDYDSGKGTYFVHSADMLGSFPTYLGLIVFSFVFFVIIFREHDILSDNIVKYLGFATLIILIVSVGWTYYESGQIENQKAEGRCKDLFNYILMAEKSQSAYAVDFRERYAKTWDQDDIDQGLANLNSNFGSVCRADMPHYIESYEAWIARSGFGGGVLPQEDKEILFRWAEQY